MRFDLWEVFNLSGYAFAVLSAIVPLMILFFLLTDRREKLRALRVAREAQRLPLDEKVAKVAELSGQLSTLNTDIRAEYELRIAEILRLKEEADEAQALASISRDAREAADKRAAETMEQVLAKRAPGDRWYQAVLTIGGFIAGVIVSLALQAYSDSREPAPEPTQSVHAAPFFSPANHA